MKCSVILTKLLPFSQNFHPKNTKKKSVRTGAKLLCCVHIKSTNTKRESKKERITKSIKRDECMVFPSNTVRDEQL